MRLQKLIILWCMFVFGLTSLHSQIVINEVMPSNNISLRDENNSDEDWIELYNTSDCDINLQGYKIYDENKFGKAFVLPDTTIKAHGYLTIFASDRNCVTEPIYAVRNMSSGIYGSSDKFFYNYRSVIGNFTTVLNIRSIRNAPAEAACGLMLRKSLDSNAEFAGIFSETELSGAIMAKERDFSGANLNVAGGARAVKYPNEIIKLERRDDSVYVAYVYNEVDYKQLHAFYFPNPTEMYIGVAATSSGEARTAEFLLNALIINGDTVAFNELSSAEIGNNSQSEIYYIREIHTNFKLSATKSETVYLWDPAGELVSTLTFPAVPICFPCDVSYGRAGNSPAFMHPATPNAENANFYSDIAAKPQFQFSAQWSDKPVEVSIINNEPESNIYYTLNGDEPTENDALYTGAPLVISKNSVLKAFAVRSGLYPSYTETKSFFIRDSSLLPVISLSIDSLSLWSKEYGLFAKEDIFFTQYAAGHFEYFDLDGQLQTESNCAVNLFGAGARFPAQKAVKFVAKHEYDCDEFKYRFFTNDPIEEYHTLQLRNGSSTWEEAMLNDAIMTAAVENQLRNVEIRNFRYVNGFINGKYWGIYSLTKQVDEQYLASKFDINKENVNLIVDFEETNSGSAIPLLTFVDEILNTDTEDENEFERIKNKIDVENFIDYSAAEFYCSNSDWPEHNNKIWNSAEYDGKWRFILYDLDATFEGGAEWNSLRDKFDVWSSIYSTIMKKLLQNQQFKFDYINRACDLANTIFLPARMQRIVDSLANIVRPEISRHQMRFPESCVNWENEISKIKDWVGSRSGHIARIYAEYFNNTQDISQITFADEINQKTYVKLNTITLTQFPWQGKYVQNVPVTITALPRAGYEFVSWSINGKKYFDNPLTITPDVDQIYIEMDFKEAAAKMPPVISEIMYKSANDAPDWVEIYNPSSESIDFSGWILRDNDDSHAFVFPENTMLKPKEYIVVTQSTEEFREKYSGTDNLLGDMNFGLGKEDEVRLFDLSGELVDSVGYTSSSPWYAECYGGGSSLELLDPFLDNTVPGNWTPSYTSGGTPGYSETDTGTNTVLPRISYSIYPNPAYEKIKLTISTISPYSAEISLVNFMGNVVEARSAVIAAGTNYYDFELDNLAPGGYFLSIRAKNGQTESVSFVKL